MTPELAHVRAAAALLSEGRFEEALARLSGASDGPTIRSLRLAAQGLLAERSGDDETATRCFDGVVGDGVPLPVLLRESGRYFKRHGRYADAHACYALLQRYDARAMREFLDGLPRADLCRYAPWAVSPTVLAGPNPGYYGLQPVKRALADELGAEAAVLAFAYMAALAPGWTAETRPLVSLHEYAASHALAYETLVESGEVTLPGAPIFGAPKQPAIPTVTRTIFFAVFADAVVSSKSNFVLAAGRALLDYQRDELQKCPVDVDVDPVAFGPDGDTVTVLVDRRATGDGGLDRALSLAGVHSSNFGHWLLEFLPKVLLCRERPGFDTVPIVIDDQMPPQHLEALRLFVGDRHPVLVLERGEAIRVRELWTVPMVAYLPVGPRPGHESAKDLLAIDGEAFARLLRSSDPVLQGLDGPARAARVYMSRKDAQHRKIANRPEVEAWFADRGFAIVDFGELTFREQLAYVRGADIVIGPDGSSNLLTFFARPGTRIGVLTNAYAEDNEWYALVCRCLGQHLSILAGEVTDEDPRYRTFSDYRIDVRSLAPFFDDLLAR